MVEQLSRRRVAELDKRLLPEVGLLETFLARSTSERGGDDWLRLLHFRFVLGSRGCLLGIEVLLGFGFHLVEHGCLSLLLKLLRIKLLRFVQIILSSSCLLFHLVILATTLVEQVVEEESNVFHFRVSK